MEVNPGTNCKLHDQPLTIEMFKHYRTEALKNESVLKSVEINFGKKSSSQSLKSVNVIEMTQK